MLREETAIQPILRELLSAVLRGAAMHDIDCLAAKANLRKGLEDRALGIDADPSALLDDCTTALTRLHAVVELAATRRVSELAPFATHLNSTAAVASLDDEGMDTFLRPIFVESGIGDRFVPSSEAQSLADRESRPTAASIELVPVALDGEALFDHLLRGHETISCESAYRAMVGPTDGPWPRARHAPIVRQIAHATSERVLGDITVGLGALIVDEAPEFVDGHRKGDDYRDSWVGQFGQWRRCDHAPSEIAAGRLRHRRMEDIPPANDAPLPMAPMPSADVGADQEVGGRRPRGAAMILTTRPVLASGRWAAPGSDRETPVAPPQAQDSATPADLRTSAARTSVEDREKTGRPTSVAATAHAPSMRQVLTAKVLQALLLAGTSVAALVVALLLIVAASLASRFVLVRADPDRESELPLQLVLTTDRFEALAVGSDPGWVTSGPGAAAAIVRIASWPTSSDRSVRVTTGAAGQAFVACRGIPASRSGAMLVQARISLSGTGDGDTSIVSVRSGDDEVAALRVGAGNSILAMSGTPAPQVAGAIDPNAWYEVSFNVDTAKGTDHVAVWRSDSLTLTNGWDDRWARQFDAGVDRICFSPPGGGAGRSIYINEVRVTVP